MIAILLKSSLSLENHYTYLCIFRGIIKPPLKSLDTHVHFYNIKLKVYLKIYTPFDDAQSMPF